MVEESQTQFGCRFPRPTGRDQPVDERLGVNNGLRPESRDGESAPQLSFVAFERERLAGGVRERSETVAYLDGQVGEEGILGSGHPQVGTGCARPGRCIRPGIGLPGPMRLERLVCWSYKEHLRTTRDRPSILSEPRLSLRRASAWYQFRGLQRVRRTIPPARPLSPGKRARQNRTVVLADVFFRRCFNGPRVRPFSIRHRPRRAKGRRFARAPWRS